MGGCFFFVFEIKRKIALGSCILYYYRPGVRYGSYKLHKAWVENCLPSQPVLLALCTPTYKLAKFPVPILKPLTTNWLTVKDSSHFKKEIVNQQLDPLFINILLQKTIENCTNDFLKESDTVEGLRKSEFKELLSWLLKVCIWLNTS